MRRISTKPRENHTKLVQSQGLVYAFSAGPEYWPDDRYYSFTSKEIELLEKASKDVFDMCCEAAEAITADPKIMTTKMAIPEFAVPEIIKSWDREPAWGSVYGRFDVCFGGLDHPEERLRTPKFYEFNADTPTSIIEAAVVQWKWLEQTGHGKDQFNSICDALIRAWKRNIEEIDKALGHKVETIHFASSKSDKLVGEDLFNTTLLMDLMDQCSNGEREVKGIFTEELVPSPKDGRFYDQQGKHIDVIFKLYPWEWMVEEKGGEACFKDMENIGKRDESGKYVGGTVWIEAPYKMLWSNKALFAILWEMFEDDPRGKWLLPTYLEKTKSEDNDDENEQDKQEKDDRATLTKFCRKAIYGREGADIILNDEGEVIQDTTCEEYGKEGFVVQQLCIPPRYEDAQGQSKYPVLGIWLVDGEPRGMGIREDNTPVTNNNSPFVPHSISDAPLNYIKEDVPTLEEIEADLKCAQKGIERYPEALDNILGLFSKNEGLHCIVRASE